LPNIRANNRNTEKQHVLPVNTPKQVLSEVGIVDENLETIMEIPVPVSFFSA
jgi:hypothetical protein